MLKNLNNLSYELLPTISKITANASSQYAFRKSRLTISSTIRNFNSKIHQQFKNPGQSSIDKSFKTPPPSIDKSFKTPSKLKFDNVNKEIKNAKTSVFGEFDKNNDGFLEKEEFRQGFTKLLPWLTKKHIDILCDEIGNKKLSFEEFEEIVVIMRGFKVTLDVRSDIIFDRCDTNRDGKLDAKEAKELMKILFTRWRTVPDERTVEEHVKNLMLHDKDKDGSITVQDFHDWLWSDDAINIFEHDVSEMFPD